MCLAGIRADSLCTHSWAKDCFLVGCVTSRGWEHDILAGCITSWVRNMISLLVISPSEWGTRYSCWLYHQQGGEHDILAGCITSSGGEHDNLACCITIMVGNMIFLLVVLPSGWGTCYSWWLYHQQGEEHDILADSIKNGGGQPSARVPFQTHEII